MQNVEELLRQCHRVLGDAHKDEPFVSQRVATLFAQLCGWCKEDELSAKAKEAPTSAEQETQAVGLSAARNFMSTRGTVAINERGTVGIITAHAKVDGRYSGVNLMTGEPWSGNAPIMVGKFTEFLGSNTGAEAWYNWLAKARGWKVEEDGSERR